MSFVLEERLATLDSPFCIFFMSLSILIELLNRRLSYYIALIRSMHLLLIA